jgi:hypothetical protein
MWYAKGLEPRKSWRLFTGYPSLKTGVLSSVGDPTSASAIVARGDAKAGQISADVSGVSAGRSRAGISQVTFHGSERNLTAHNSNNRIRRQSVSGPSDVDFDSLADDEFITGTVVQGNTALISQTLFDRKVSTRRSSAN